jgi:hypothetical protein
MKPERLINEMNTRKSYLLPKDAQNRFDYYRQNRLILEKKLIYNRFFAWTILEQSIFLT